MSKSNHFIDALLGGWQYTESLTWSTDFFLTPLWTGADPTGTANTTSATAPTVTIRPNVVANPNLPAGQRTVSNWYNLAAFAPPAAGSFGNAGKGIVIGPGSFVVDMGIAKTFSIASACASAWSLPAPIFSITRTSIRCSEARPQSA
jgi:hypothetical protein